MACKNRLPEKRCGECSRINREAYRGAGKEVCYELESRDGKKVATTVTEDKKACGRFWAANKIGRVG